MLYLASNFAFDSLLIGWGLANSKDDVTHTAFLEETTICSKPHDPNLTACRCSDFSDHFLYFFAQRIKFQI